MAQDMGEAARERAHGDALRSAREPRLGQQHGGAGEEHGAAQAHGEEARAPVEPLLQNAPDDGGDDGRHPHDDAHERELTAGRHAGVQIAHDRAREHDGTSRAESLERARGDERLDGGRGEAGERGGDVEHEAAEQQGPAAIDVGRRPIDELAQREAHDIGRHRQLHRAGRRREHGGDLRHGCEIEIDRERPERRHGGEQNRHGRANAATGRMALSRRDAPLEGGRLLGGRRAPVRRALPPRGSARLAREATPSYLVAMAGPHQSQREGLEHGALAQLNTRSREIFRRIVDIYLESGEPVGSRQLSRLLPMTLSAASVRNVMQDLEELGLVYAPHTSAGRLPTELGLRFFVDALLEIGDVPGAERSRIEAQMRASRGQSMQNALSEATSLLSGLTRGAGVVLTTKDNARLKHIEFVRLEPERALAVLVGEDESVENRVLVIPRGLPPSALVEAGNYLNARIRGRTLAEVRAEIEAARGQAQRELDERAERLVEAGLAFWAGMGESPQLIVRGQANLLEDLTALADLERIRLLFADLETKKDVIDLLSRAEQGEGVRIFIGSENKLFSLSGSSMIAAPFRDEERRIVGVLGVIGPTRLNYARVRADGRLYREGDERAHAAALIALFMCVGRRAHFDGLAVLAAVAPDPVLCEGAVAAPGFVGSKLASTRSKRTLSSAVFNATFAS